MKKDVIIYLKKYITVFCFIFTIETLVQRLSVSAKYLPNPENILFSALSIPVIIILFQIFEKRSKNIPLKNTD